MDTRDRNTIQRNIMQLSRSVNLEPLYKELLHKNVILYNDVERLRKMYPVREEQAVEFFLRYTKRGPRAFPVLIDVLRSTGHESEANLLLSHVSDSDSGYYDGVEPTTGLFSSGTSSPSLSLRSTPEGSPRQLHSKLSQVTMEDIPPLQIEVKPATMYNNQREMADCYQMMSRPRGYALIINNIDFPGNPNASRVGAAKDTENLDAVLKLLHFEVTIRLNVLKQELLKAEGILDIFISQFARTDVDCCVVAVMSHGTEGYFLTSDSESLQKPDSNRVSIWDDFLPRFNNRNCPALRNKPKIFVLQACRGEVKDRGVMRTSTDSVGNEEDRSDSSESSGSAQPSSSDSSDRMPTYEDMLICQSTVPGFVSNRDTQRGTWYIDSLCYCLSQHAHELEFTKILQMVGRRMRSICSEYGDKQMCSFNNTGFHYDLYLNPGLFTSNP